MVGERANLCDGGGQRIGGPVACLGLGRREQDIDQALLAQTGRQPLARDEDVSRRAALGIEAEIARTTRRQDLLHLQPHRGRNVLLSPPGKQRVGGDGALPVRGQQ